jgi:hypothetical protein
MRIADNLACHCAYYRGQADVDEALDIDKRASRVKIAKRFSRLAFACVAGDEPMKHPAFRKPDSILAKRDHQHDRDDPHGPVKASIHLDPQRRMPLFGNAAVITSPRH